MMKPRDITRQVRKVAAKYGLGPDDYVIGFGAACVMHGLRLSTTDIEIDVRPDVFSRLIVQTAQKREPDLLSYRLALAPNFTAHDAFPVGYGITQINGLPVYTCGLLLYRYRLLLEHDDRSLTKKKMDRKMVREIHAGYADGQTVVQF